MAVPWLRILDTMLNLTDLARGRSPRPAGSDSEQLAAATRPGGALETRLAGVVVAALKEAFDRDSRRLEFEREQMDRERERADRLLRIELLRQAGDREIGRMRMIAGVSLAAWIGTLFFFGRLGGGPIGARVAFGGGWLMLLAALAVSFAAQSRIARALGGLDRAGVLEADLSAGPQGTIAGVLIVAGLAAIAVAVLIG